MLDTLDIWDEKIALTGADIISDRIEYIKKLQIKATEIYRGISGEKEELSIKYLSNVQYESEEKENIASFEFILRILAECESVSEARRVIKSINITDTAFSSKYPPSPLHWIISDENDCITVEQTEKGLEIIENALEKE